MKALVVRRPGGLKNTRIEEVDEPKDRIIVRVVLAGLNPVDISTINGITNYNITPYPHIPGANFVGFVESVNETDKFRVGDRVVIYPKIHDGTCDKCKMGREQLCRNGGTIGIICNGGYSEYFGTDEKNLEMIPDSMSLEEAVSIPDGGLAAYHALKRADLKKNERLLVIGASGNTGIYSVLLGKLMGAEVFYVSRKKWIAEMGVREWKEEKVDVIVNPLGSELWGNYIDYLDSGGRVVTFGSLTGRIIKLDIANLYKHEISIIGSTGGTRKEFLELIDLISKNNLSSKLWKVFDLEEYEEAIMQYEKRDGKIVFRISSEVS